MSKVSEMERLYEEYINRDDLLVRIDNRDYYRIVKKESFFIFENIILITVPWELLFGSKCECKVIDENNNIFDLGKPIHINFRDYIPEWYLNTVTVAVDNINNPNLIGEYVAIFET